jgi:hypothetical protein
MINQSIRKVVFQSLFLVFFLLSRSSRKTPPAKQNDEKAMRGSGVAEGVGFLGKLQCETARII